MISSHPVTRLGHCAHEATTQQALFTQQGARQELVLAQQATDNCPNDWQWSRLAAALLLVSKTKRFSNRSQTQGLSNRSQTQCLSNRSQTQCPSNFSQTQAAEELVDPCST